MTFKTPLWQEDSTYSATLDRELIDRVFRLPGVLVSTDLVVTQRAAGANISVDVAAGACVITGTSVAGQGKYLCVSDAVANVPLAAVPGSGQSRFDLIIGQVRDADADGGANNDWLVTKVTGTAAATGTQVAPAVPASSIVLAQVLVGPLVGTIVNANITDKRVTGGNPVCRVHRNAAFSTSGNPVILFDVVDKDNAGGYSTATGKYTVPVAGTYLISAKLESTPVTAAEFTDFQIFHNTTGLGQAANMSVTAGSTTNMDSVCVTDIAVDCAVGDTLYVKADGTGMAGIPGATSTYMVITRVG